MRAALGVPLVVPEVNMMAAASLGGFIGFNKNTGDDAEVLEIMSWEKACLSVTGIEFRMEEALLLLLVSR